MMAIAFIVVAGVCTVLRALATGGQARDQIPWRTLAVNCGGAFLFGLVLAADWFDNPVVITSAGLGSLTTFSTVAAESAGLIDDDRTPTAIAYVGLTVVVGVAAAWLGLSIGETL